MGIEITITAIAYVAFSVFAQRKLINMKRMREVQDVIKAKTKELNELSKNKAGQDVLMAKQKEITSLLSESMRSQFKPMFVIMPAFLMLYYLIFPAAFPTNPNVTVPILSMTLNYKVYFVAVAFVLGIASSVGLSVYDRLKRSKEANKETTPIV